MKMKPEDFESLKNAIRPVFVEHPNAWAEYNAAGLSGERFRWDVLHASRFQTGPLYSYLNDSHIYTALKAIIPNNS